jgi:dipeptidyl aminopeptidase/acylaminoacyl peptidase
VRTVFSADPGDGSRFAGVTAARDVWWTEGDRLVFPWEKGGWKRLWSVPSAGGDPILLTPGEHVVQHAALAPDGRTLVFDSNRDDLDRKHIWTVRADGSRLRLLTPGDGIEWAPVALASGAVAFLGSGATEPARPFVLPAEAALDGTGGRAVDRRITPRGPLPASFPSGELVVPESVTFPATDGRTVYGQLFLPPEASPGERRPAVLFFHGGSRRQMLLGFHNRGYYHNAYAMNQYLAARGHVVLAVNYRSGVGYGLHFREAEDYGAEGATEVRDVIGAALWIRARPDVDPDRVGLWGGSYGGFLTAQGLVHAPELFAAGVDIHGVHDWNEGIQNFRPDYEPENLPDLSRRAFQASPMALVDRWEDPVLLIHGDDDRNVRFTETVSLARELTLRDVPHEVLVFPDEVHGFLMHRNWLRAFEATAAWFEEWLER